MTDEKTLNLFVKYYGAPFYHHAAVIRGAIMLLKKRGDTHAEAI